MGVTKDRENKHIFWPPPTFRTRQHVRFHLCRTQDQGVGATTTSTTTTATITTTTTTTNITNIRVVMVTRAEDLIKSFDSINSEEQVTVLEVRRLYYTLIHLTKYK